MHSRIVAILAAILFTGLFAGVVVGQNAEPKKKLEVGDPAPAVNVNVWVKGDPVRKFEKNKVYVVEFWATWCRPCVDAIPHLTQLQQKHRREGLTIIGIAASERGRSDQDKLRQLRNFVSRQQRNMDYTVAFAADGKMHRDWMQAAERRGIPSAFLVDKHGKIAWIGHPRSGLDKAIEAALKAPDSASAVEPGAARDIAAIPEVSAPCTGDVTTADAARKSTETPAAPKIEQPDSAPTSPGGGNQNPGR